MMESVTWDILRIGVGCVLQLRCRLSGTAPLHRAGKFILASRVSTSRKADDYNAVVAEVASARLDEAGLMGFAYPASVGRCIKSPLAERSLRESWMIYPRIDAYWFFLASKASPLMMRDSTIMPMKNTPIGTKMLGHIQPITPPLPNRTYAYC